MPVKTKATPEEKIRIAQLCDSGRLSQGQAAEQMGVSKITIQSWLTRCLEPDYIWLGFRPADTVHSHTSSSGVLIFDVKDPQKDFRLIIDGSYIGTEDEDKCEAECYFEFAVEV